MTATIHSIGHNRGPEMPLDARLASDHEELVSKVESVATLAAALPEAVRTEADVTDFVDITSRAKKAAKAIDDVRVKEKEPFLTGTRTVDSFFNPLIERLKRIATQLENRVGDYQREKARQERLRREEEARQQREAERIAREEAERKLREAEEAEAANATTVERTDKLGEAVIADQVAAKASMKAEVAEHRAAADIKDLGRVRTSAGTASIQTVWRFEIQDGFAIDLNKLRGHFTQGAVEQAVGDFVRKGGRELAGVRIYEDVKTVVR
jgi:hypothetical protein